MGVNKTFTVNVCPEESPVPLSSRNSGGGGVGEGMVLNLGVANGH